MAFADKEFYKNEYLQGRAEIIPPLEFGYWANQASVRINWKKIPFEKGAEFPEYLRMCTCELAEAYFLESERKFAAMLPSQSVDGYSRGATTGGQQSRPELEQTFSGIIYKWLANTDLHNDFIYRGV